MLCREGTNIRKSSLRWLFFILAGACFALVISSCGEGKPTIRPTEVLTPTPGATPGPTATPIVSRPVAAAESSTVSLGNDIVMRIPAGALSADTTVTVTRATGEQLAPGELKWVKAVSPAFHIDLGEEELAKPVTLELAYDVTLLPEGAPEDGVFAAYYDESLFVVYLRRLTGRARGEGATG